MQGIGTIAALVVGAATGPVVDAWLAPDGRVELRLRADADWRAAEVVVDGDRGEPVGAMRVGEERTVRAVAEAGRRELPVRVVAALADGRGVAWEFTVRPALVPVAPPPLRPPRPGLLERWFGRGR